MTQQMSRSEKINAGVNMALSLIDKHGPPGSIKRIDESMRNGSFDLFSKETNPLVLAFGDKEKGLSVLQREVSNFNEQTLVLAAWPDVSNDFLNEAWFSERGFTN